MQRHTLPPLAVAITGGMCSIVRMPPLSFSEIEIAVAATGLMVRGGFYPAPEDKVPDNPACLILLGNAGPNLWQKFDPSKTNELNPLDTWTQRIVNELGETLGAQTLFPFDGPPYLPFQRWAQRCEAVFPSPIGPLIHPIYGLWHAYRAALAFTDHIDVPVKDEQPHPCETCAEKLCLTTCPVEAFQPGQYNVPACVDFVTSDRGQDCLDRGCAARRACPVGQDYIYESTQAGFHMQAFASSQKP